MAELLATPATDGLLPITYGPFGLTDAAPARITSVAPLAGQTRAFKAALKAMGLGWPAPNRQIRAPGGRIVRTGAGQAFLLEADPAPLAGLGALTDQTDAWATLRLTGPAPDEVLARLIPVDLRPGAFGEDAALRTALGHMMSVVLRAGDGIEIMVFRSMARTAVHEIAAAMSTVAARRG